MGLHHTFARRPSEHCKQAVLRGDECDGVALIVHELRAGQVPRSAKLRRLNEHRGRTFDGLRPHHLGDLRRPGTPHDLDAECVQVILIGDDGGAVDGATVITDQYDLHAFGIKIVRRSGSAQISQVMRTQPIEGASPMLIEPSQLGGTRHLSGAQFVHDQRDSIALVASQDGLFTVFGWSPCEGMVQAHRVDALLL